MIKQKPLCIVESSSKCPKIVSLLNNKYDCVATGGHICTIKDGLKSIDLNDVLNTKFKTSSCPKLRKEIKSHKEIILATDNDREGEAIAWHICRIFKLNTETTKRIIFNEITKPALLKAVNNPTTIDMDLVKSQVTRQIVDILVGFNISPLLWKNIAATNTLSAGRCQTPTLMILKDREDEINESDIKICYSTEGFFTSKNIKFILDKKLDKETIDEFYNLSINFKYELSRGNISKSESQPPFPLITSTMQQHMGNKFGYSPKKTMTIAQSLYQKGYITYMRTDSCLYSNEFKELCFKFISDTYGDNYIGNPRTKKIINSQEAHEAIRPTCLLTPREDLEVQEKKIYNEIKKITIQSCMSKCVQNTYTAKITAPKNYSYKKQFFRMLFQGWKILDNVEPDNYYDYVLNIKTVSCKKIKSKFDVLNKKTHLTESQLVKRLEEKGIGRPSTYSSLIEKIKDREYVKKKTIDGVNVTGNEYELCGIFKVETKVNKKIGEEKNKLVLTPLGKEVLSYLKERFDTIFSYEFTAELERKLDDNNHEELCDYYNNEIKKRMDKSENEYEIQPGYIVKTGKYGLYIKNGDNNIKLKPGITINKIVREKLSLDDVVFKDTNCLVLTENISIKYGKYGWYIFYKTSNMNRPQFYPLKKYDFDINNCDKMHLLEWINNTHNIYG